MTLALPQLDTAPGYRRVALLIEREIVAGRLRTGELLPIEGDLAAQLGVNRSTLREGLRALEDAGLVRRVRGKRLMVTVPDGQAMAWANTRAMGLRQVCFTDLWEIQMELEPLCARLAAGRMDAAMADRLEANLAETEARLDDDQAVIALDIAFHRLLAEATANPALPLVAEPVGRLLFSATQDLYRAVPAARHRLLAAHRQIVAALKAGDAATAGQWMTRHIQDFRRGYQVGGLDMTRPIALQPAQPGGA